MWLMMAQRWDGKATLSTAVQQVVEKRPAALLEITSASGKAR